MGSIVDLTQCNAMCNLYVAGRALGSGPLVVGVQCSDSTTSGSFTDPTSGLSQLPTWFSSGGFIIIGSGPDPAGVRGSGVSGSMIQSGFLALAGFQRTGQFARVIVASGFMDVTCPQAGFMSQLRTTGSGGGFSLAPSSGAVSV